jgi:transcriptional regulator with XRE-family HTH domain
MSFRKKQSSVFGKNLELLRVIHNLNQEEMITRLNTSQPVYSRYETGDKEVDENNEFVQKAAAAFGITAKALVSKEINIKIFEEYSANKSPLDVKELGDYIIIHKETLGTILKQSHLAFEQTINLFAKKNQTA